MRVGCLADVLPFRDPVAFGVPAFRDNFYREADCMNQHAPGVEPSKKKTATASSGRGLLQRKCSRCGSRSKTGGECEDCRNKQVQAKLAVGAVNDRHEQEADRVAEQVLEGRNPGPHPGSSPVRIQRLSSVPGSVEVPESAAVERAIKAGGRPMSPGLRLEMERRFGHDFSRVRVHTGDAAAASAEALGADAYTTGPDVVFAANRYAPHTRDGQRLLAHELTHVVQQSSAAGGTSSSVVFRHAADKSKCLSDPDWKRIDASPQEVYAPANDAIESSYKDSHKSNAILTGSQFESGGKPGSSGIQLPKGAPGKGSCDKLLGKFLGVSRQLSPDVMDCTERVFYEIKTNQFAGKGAEQVLSYYKLANEFAAQNSEPPWKIDLAGWYPPHILMMEPTRRVCTEGTDYSRTQRPGLVIYEVQDRKDRKERKEEEEREAEKQEKKKKEDEAAAAKRRAKLRKVKDFVDQLEREVDLSEGDNRLQLNLINKPSYFGFWGYWTNELFNAQPPLLTIWAHAYDLLSAARIQIRAGDPVKALQRLVEARIAYLEALKKYHTWKDNLPGAAAKMQTAIVVSAVVALAAFVAPTVVARAASSASGTAGTAANLVAAENAVTQAGVRIAAGEAQIAGIEASIAELEIVTSADLEAEMFVLKMMTF